MPKSVSGNNAARKDAEMPMGMNGQEMKVMDSHMKIAATMQQCPTELCICVFYKLQITLNNFKSLEAQIIHASER